MLEQSIQNLKGVGDKIITPLTSLLKGDKVIDLLTHRPTRIINRKLTTDIAQVRHGSHVTLQVMISEHLPSARRGGVYKVYCSNDFCGVYVAYFNYFPKYMRDMLPVGQERIISGVVEVYNGQVTIPHPDYILKTDELDKLPKLEPVYPLSKNIGQKLLIKLIAQCLPKLPEQDEWLDSNYMAKNNWLSWDESIKRMHYPEHADDLDIESPIITRLAFDEMLAHQIALRQFHQQTTKQQGAILNGKGLLAAKILQNLPFDLSPDQKQVLADISQDIKSGNKMLRLLQGDVGSGKTIIGLLAISYAIETNSQACFMAPTTLLANQVYNNFCKYCDGLNINIGLITSNQTKAAKNKIKQQLINHEIDILVGTHAVIQEDVDFADNNNALAMCIIDEQHRFGVVQRDILTNKNPHAHLLMMTATPIPRTLTMVCYGDIDVSYIKHKPAGRQPIDTRVIPLARLSDVLSSIKRALSEGEKIYWICPLVEESENFNYANVEDRFKFLQQVFTGTNIGLVHGKIKKEQKDKTMLAFKNGEIQMLIATTVIEVGIDIHDANIMFIENAEKFGLSQLHQLRGRVGRGQDKASCILLYDSESISPKGRERLKIMQQSNDGFEIAEKDMLLRGSGDLVGTKQSGLPDFKFADLFFHQQLFKDASKQAQYIASKGVNERQQKLLNLYNY